MGERFIMTCCWNSKSQADSQEELSSSAQASATNPDQDPPSLLPQELPKAPITSVNRLRLTKSLSNIADHDVAAKIAFTRSQSTAEWDRPNQTLIFWDWDDSCFPTTWLRAQYPKLKWHEPMDPSSPYKATLDECSNNIARTLTTASQLGKVYIVTLASSPWVSISIRNFMPELEATIERLGIRIVYARDELLDSESEKQVGRLSTALKGRAMHRLANEFYSQYERQSWKNVISFGDSMFEAQALRNIVYDHRKEETVKKLRAKTLKLAEAPDMAQINAQLSVIDAWMRPIVIYDDDFDIDLDGPIDDVLKWQQTFGIRN